MSEELLHQKVITMLNRLSGWWRLWLLLLLAAFCFGVYEGLQDSSTYIPRMREFWCVPGTFDSSHEYLSCVSVRDLLGHVLRRTLPALLILPTVWVVGWVFRGFEKSDLNP